MFLRVEEFNWGSAKDLPASWALHGIDSCLSLRNRHRALRNDEPRCFETRDDQCLRKFSHVRKSRHEADHIDEIRLAAMESNHFFGRALKIFGHPL